MPGGSRRTEARNENRQGFVLPAWPDETGWPGTASTAMPRALPIGAEPTENGTSFRIWALDRRIARVVVDGIEHALEAEGNGYFSAEIPGIGVGARYGFKLDGSDALLPDLASKWQPEGPQGASVVCASDDFPWTDQAWPGLARKGQVLYEMHLGTFTREGTWAAASQRLATLKDIGITVIQIMPIGEFSGRFGWGYDTVLPYAPSYLYGTPDDARRFIDHAHGLGLGVILDVVYNHAGIGDHFRDYTQSYFTDRHVNEWGSAFNLDGENAHGVREFIVQNAVYWIRDFHFDGLRLDATQALLDDSDDHIIAQIARETRAAAGGRSLYLSAENQPQDRQLLDPPAQGGYGLDALANDDFHHSARVALTGHNDFYYSDYLGTPQELVSSTKFGYLYQGQRSDMRDSPYGTNCLDMSPDRFVHFLENHDQIANSARGLRLDKLGSPARARALTALLLLGPQTPLLFQGQEFGASSPFYYFFGVEGAAAASVAEGRIANLSKFPGVSDPEMTAALADPSDPKTFKASKLDWSDFERHSPVVALHRDLLALRRSDPAFARRGDERRMDGAVLNETSLLLRFFADERADDRLLMLNLGRDYPIQVLAEPLMAPPPGHKWAMLWSSESPRYGGSGRRPIDTAKCWVLPGNTALVLGAVPLKAG
jgi:maltooligosyltrehalose trehalohydrolase